MKTQKFTTVFTVLNNIYSNYSNTDSKSMNAGAIGNVSEDMFLCTYLGFPEVLAHNPLWPSYHHPSWTRLYWKRTGTSALL